MAKTIKEIVLELKNHPIRHNNGALWETGYREGCQFGAIHGANYVLEQIEKYLDDEDCVSRILSNYDDIKEIVLELKGE